jgi:WXG100 family type VII secretion target
MATYQVDSEQVLRAAQATHTTIARLHSEVATLNAHLQSLSSCWTGPAATSFSAVHTQWHTTQLRVEENLASLSQALGSAGRHYQEMEAANQALFSR